MRTFEYVCPKCLYVIEREIPGTEPPPDTLEIGPHIFHDFVRRLAGECDHPVAKRVWISTRLNLGYRPVVHDDTDKWMFKHG